MFTRHAFPWVLAVNAALAGIGAEPIDIPLRPARDGIMAQPAEMRDIQEWARAAFTGDPAKPAGNSPRITVRRQDHNTLHFGESCMETPLKIGSHSFKHGLGTHARSEIVVSLPQGVKSFKAFAGIDNNYDTQGVRGSARFSVEIAGKEVFRTETLKGGGEPVKVEVPVPRDARDVVLIVDPTEDGSGFDQADWAEAQLVMADGSVKWLDENRSECFLRASEAPFSFEYGGTSSARLLSGWKHTAKVNPAASGFEYEATWADPETGLAVTAVAKVFTDYPAVDWLLYFENRGSKDTPLLENLRTGDVELETGNSKRKVLLHQLRGDSCSEQSYNPFDLSLDVGKNTTLAPTRGRPSQETAFPFWNVQYRDNGVITAVGWSGQWSAVYERASSGVTRFRAGMEKTHLVLHPGEKIRTPRVLMMSWKGDLRAAHNRFRRLMLFEYVPKQAGRPQRLPICLQDFDRYIGRPGWATEAGQLEGVQAAHRMGFDTYWFDAGWFVGDFPNGVGNWFAKPKEFPNGLKPISDLCHKNGQQFIVWFEPCRVAPGTQIAREHPEFVLGGEKGGLFDLGNPEARKWITDFISRRLTEFGIDVYREDYNIDPLRFWTRNDAPDRQGMTEIRFVEGHYAFWDELRARHPGLWIDNCASGGRRIDLETCMRAVPLWRSDTSCSPGHPEWNQQQAMALSQYIPLHTASAWDPEHYIFRSSATGGILCEMDYLNPAFSVDRARALLDEVKANQKYWYGDFYPLSPVSTALDQFAAWQLHRADLDEGCVLAFRRPQCDTRGLIVDLRGLTASHSYLVEFFDEGGKRTTSTLSGKQLEKDGLELRVPSKGESLLVRYKRK
jgi:alpha-galactosidase